jgi:hypothetical protein
MTKVRTFFVPEPGADGGTTGDQRPDDTLAAAIRKPVDALDAAAEEAAKGMLGGAKLGLLVAANLLIDALEAVDAEFARRSAIGAQGHADRGGLTEPIS